jgi:F-type H+-transporting ATPase subunit a
VFAIDFPPISHLVEWPDILFEGAWYAVNKIVIQYWVSALIVFAFVFFAGRNFKLVPSGLQSIGESFYGFIQNGIIMQTMGSDGLRYTSFLGTLFGFIFITNIWGIIPAVQMPVNARMALPAFLAALVWIIFVVVGFAKQGPRYLTNTLFPPGVPKPLYILVTPIEFVSTFLVRPFSIAVRLFANLLAGHLLLVAFAVICAALWKAGGLALAILPLSFGMLIGLTAFELLVAFLQAFIFTVLAAVYIGSSMHAEH